MRSPRGMTLIDVLVGTALMLVIFLALFGILRASLLLSSLIKSEATATAIANSQMEYIRSLPYDSVGTVGGIPAGNLAQTATTTEDGVTYTVRTLIEYYDDPADGTGSNDTNGVTTDYKKIKVTVSYEHNGSTRSVTLNSQYSPKSLETSTGGGTLQVQVVNASGNPVSGATVHVTNSSVSPAVDLSTLSDINGQVYLPGAATSTDYYVNVTKAGYSTAETYARDATNQNPTPGYLTVVQDQTTSGTFAIDALGALTLKTFAPVGTITFSDDFTDSSKLRSLTNTSAGGGSLVLAGGALSGSAISSTTDPSYLVSWGQVTAGITAPAGSTAAVQVVDGSGTPLPDSVLPGNSTGFSSFPVSLGGVSTSTYPALALQALLTRNATTTAPAITTWSLTATAGPVPLPNVSFTLTGAKTIGSTGAGAPIYKTTVNGTTDSTASKTLSLEWDSYSLAVSGYDIVDACSAPPYALTPGGSLTETVTLDTRTSNALLVTVTNSSGATVSGATVTLSNGGSPVSATTSSCGNASFSGLTAGSGYSITISKSGYTTTTYSNVTVGGHTFYVASF